MRHLKTCILITITILVGSACSTESTPVYQLSTSAEPSEAGSVTQSATEAEEGETITVTANPNEHWVFTGWSGGHSGTNNPVNILMDIDKSVTAVFVKKEYPLTVTIDGEGTVKETVIQQKTTDYKHGTVVQLEAFPAEGWEFTEWIGDLIENQNPINFIVDGETSVTALFERIEHPLTIEIQGQGEVQETVVQVKSTDYFEGAVIELKAIADEGWSFSSWNGDINEQNNPVNITMNEPKEVTAIFSKTYRLSTIAEPEEGGTVVPSDTVLVVDSEINLEAIPNQGWRFVNWQGDKSGDNNPFSITIESDLNITAFFEKETYQVVINTDGNGSVSYQPPKDTYVYGDELELQANPDNTYAFIRWSGDLSSTNQNESFTVTGNHNISAVFRKPSDVVKQRWGSRATINDNLISAGLSLENELPKKIIVTEFRLLNQNGSLLARSTETNNVGSGSSLTYTISFNSFVSISTFSNYSGDWRFTYNGNNYRKVAKVGSFGTTSKILNDGPDNKVIDIETLQ